MRNSILVILSLFTIQAMAANGSQDLCDEQVSLAESNVRVAKDHFAVGEGTRQTVLSAELTLLETKWVCLKISKDKYCAGALSKVDQLVRSFEENEKIGSATFEDVLKAKYSRTLIQVRCAN